MTINPKTHIEIPADKVREAIKTAYDMSHPVGMGLLQPHANELREEEIDEILAIGRGWIAVRMDYVNGRQCKFNVYSDEGNPARYFVAPYWYDHSEYELVILLSVIGVENAKDKIDAANIERKADAV